MQVLNQMPPISRSGLDGNNLLRHHFLPPDISFRGASKHKVRRKKGRPRGCRRLAEVRHLKLVKRAIGRNSLSDGRGGHRPVM